MTTGLRWLVLAVLCVSASLAQGATLGEDDTQLNTMIQTGKDLSLAHHVVEVR